MCVGKSRNRSSCSRAWGVASLARQADDSVPIGRRDPVVLRDEHGEEILGSVGGGHGVQAAVGGFPVPGDEVVDPLFELFDVIVGQFRPLVLRGQEFADGMRRFKSIGKDSSQATDSGLVTPQSVSGAVGGWLIHQDGDMQLSGQAFESAGEVDDGAEDSDFDLVGGADFPGDGASVGESDAEREVGEWVFGVTGGFLDFAANAKCRSAGVLRGGGCRERPAPEPQCRIALEIASDTAEAVNLSGDDSEDAADAVQECDEVVGRSFGVS